MRICSRSALHQRRSTYLDSFYFMIFLFFPSLADEAEIVNWSPLKFYNYDARGSIEAENNGHTELVQGFQSWTKKPYITEHNAINAITWSQEIHVVDQVHRVNTAPPNELVVGKRGNLVGRYYLQQFHFHWDGNDRFGSEHTLDGLHYPLEVHLVHIRQDLNETTAPHVPDGIAVVAVQFQLATKDEALFNLEKVTEATNSSESKSGDPSYTPGSLLPHDTSAFFRYSGSLTTPPCSENVLWSILVEPNYVSEKQLRILRRHLREDGSLLIDNWRTIQSMNGRTLYLNKKKAKPVDATMDVARMIAPVIAFGVIVAVIV